MYVVMLVLDDQELLAAVLDSWQKAGVTGATVIESTGMHRVRACRARVHARFDFARIADECPEGHYTLFALVDSLETVEGCLVATERVTGDLSAPNTGVFAAWPAAMVKGLPGPANPQGHP